MKPSIFIFWFAFLLLFFSPGNTVAQLSEAEKILLQIPKETSDTSKIKLMIRYSMIYAPLRDFGKWFGEIHRLSLKNNYRPGLMYQRFYEGLLLADKGKYDEAIAKVKHSIDGLDSLGIVQGVFYPLYQIRFIYFLAGKQVEMFQYYTDKIIYYKRFGPVENTANCYHGLGLFFDMYENHDKAIGYSMRALNVYRLFDTLGVLNEKGIIAIRYLEWGNVDKAELYFKSGLNEKSGADGEYVSDYFDLLGDICFQKRDYKQALQNYYVQQKYLVKLEPFFRANNLLRIATAHLQSGSNDSARFYLEAADKIREKEESSIYFANQFRDIDFAFYQYYAAIGNGNLALHRLQKSLKKAQSTNNIKQVLRCTKELHSFLLKQGDSIQSLHYLIQYHKISDSLDKTNTQARIASFEIEQQTQVKEDEIEELHLQKATQRNYYLFGGVLLLLIVLAILSRLRYKRKRDKEQLTSDFKNQLARAETKALRAQMNPHFIFNSLNSINSFVMDQQHELASEYLIKFSKLIRLILDNSRSETISIEKELETLKLYVLLEAARFDNKFKCVYHIADDVNTSSVMIPPMLLQPFVENAIWHGLMQKEGEGTITIGIQKQDEEFLKISITDDGIGREKAAQLKSKSATHKSHGLKVTSQRIEMMNKLNSSGAKVTIVDLRDEQGDAAGTKVEVVIPF